MTTPTDTPAPTQPSSGAPDPRPVIKRSNGDIDRRTIIWSAIVLGLALTVGVVVVAVTYDPGTATPSQVTAPSGAPRIITPPNSGKAPEQPGDRGGWEQLALLAAIVVVVSGIGVYATHGGGAKAKANRAAWKAAGESGRDGALG